MNEKGEFTVTVSRQCKRAAAEYNFTFLFWHKATTCSSHDNETCWIGPGIENLRQFCGVRFPPSSSSSIAFRSDVFMKAMPNSYLAGSVKIRRSPTIHKNFTWWCCRDYVTILIWHSQQPLTRNILEFLGSDLYASRLHKLKPINNVLGKQTEVRWRGKEQVDVRVRLHPLYLSSFLFEVGQETV